MSDVLARLAVRAVQVLVVEAPGQWLTRVELEQQMLRRGWRPAWTPADADMLAVCGVPGPDLSELVDRLWEQMPGPRVRVDIASPTDTGSALDDAVTLLLDTAHHGKDARERAQEPEIPDDHGGQMDHEGMDHGGHGGHEDMDHGDMDDSEHGAMDHSDMDHGEHGDMDHSEHEGHEDMDHGDHRDHEGHEGHKDMERGEHGTMDHSDMDHGEHGDMDHSEHEGHEDMDHGDMDHSDMDHGDHEDMDHSEHDGHEDMDTGDHGDHGGHGGHGGMDHSGHDGHEDMDTGDHGGHGDHGGMDHSGHGGMDMAPGGIPLAQGGEDRDGLEMDVLHLPLGPVLPFWPAGLVLRCSLQGDVVVDAEASVVDGDRRAAGSLLPPLGSAPAAAVRCDNAERVLALAGAEDAAARARRARDALLRGDQDTAGEAIDRLHRTVRRSRALRWSLRNLLSLDGTDLERHGLPESCRGDAYDRLLSLVERIRAEIGGADPAPVDTAAVPWDAVPQLVTGLELGSVRLAVAGLDLDPFPAVKEVGHV